MAHTSRNPKPFLQQILEGLATIVASFIAAWVLPADVPTARFLSAEEKAFASKPIPCRVLLLVYETGIPVRRFQADIITTDEPNGHQTGISQKSSSPTDGEKDSEHRVEGTGSVLPAAATPILSEQEEQFEWGEVLRGKYFVELFSEKKSADALAVGFTDIQTWLTGMAYCGLVVSLYSYSLFL